MGCRSCAAGALLSLFLCAGQFSHGETPLTTVRVATGLTRPVFVTAPPGDNKRLFIVEQRSGSVGTIRILDLTTGTLLPSAFFTISPVTTGSEQGLLGLAFHPDYASNRQFYVNFTESGGGSAGRTVVARYLADPVNPNTFVPGSRQDVIRIDQPFSNHNGGWIGFGPDGYLYVSMGDGGSGGDPQANAQNLNVLLGKLLRLDVDGDDFPSDVNANYRIPSDNPFVGIGRGEIWAYGMRNAWRCSFDRETHDLWIADVGQGTWEEIDFQPAGSPGGENYGWRCYEGNASYNSTNCAAPNTMVFPIYAYSHSSGCSISGGYVYRGGICDLRGTYFFSDYCSNQIWTFRYDGANVLDFRNRTTELQPNVGSFSSIVSFGEDNRGELYICSLSNGSIFKIVVDGPGKGDANADGAITFKDVNPFVLALSNPASYELTYGVPATQTCDFNCDGAVTFKDIDPFVAKLGGN